MHRRLKEKEEIEEQMLEKMKHKEQEMKEEMKRQKVCEKCAGRSRDSNWLFRLTLAHRTFDLDP